MSFDQLLDGAEELSLEEQETFLELLKRRVLDRRRSELFANVATSRREFDNGHFSTGTTDEIMRQVLE